jgi:lipopolysaccharide transport system ATP-binding protein
MNASVELFGVTLDYAVYSVRAQSLRSSVLGMAVGGRLMKDQQDVTVIRPCPTSASRLRRATGWAWWAITDRGRRPC